MTHPASTDSLTGTMARLTRHYRGITGGGTAAPAARAAATIPISGWKCANRRVSSTHRAAISPAPTRLRQRRWRKGLMRRRWSCSPCSVKSTALTRLRTVSSSATRKAVRGALPATTATRSICGRSLGWGTRWTDSARRSKRQWAALLLAQTDTPRSWGMPRQRRSR